MYTQILVFIAFDEMYFQPLAHISGYALFI